MWVLLLVPIFLFLKEVLSINNQQKGQRPNREQAELVNEMIKFKELLVIGSDGSKYGVISRAEALHHASELGLDLVVVAAEAKPPVAKIMDYKKYLFEKKKAIKEAKRNQHVTVVKEVQLSPVIEKHDLETKANIARKFLEKDNRVKVTLRFRGRMITHQDLGLKVMNDFSSILADVSQVDIPAKLEGKFLSMTLAPKKDK